MPPLKNMGPLYKEAIDFVLTNNHLLETDPAVQELALLSAKYTGQAGYSGANHLLWELFQIHKDNTLRVEILMALGETAGGDDELIESINQFLVNENSRYLTGMRTVSSSWENLSIQVPFLFFSRQKQSIIPIPLPVMLKEPSPVSRVISKN